LVVDSSKFIADSLPSALMKTRARRVVSLVVSLFGGNQGSRKVNPVIAGRAANVVAVLAPYAAMGAQEFAKSVGKEAYEKEGQGRMLAVLKAKRTTDQEATDALVRFEEKPERYILPLRAPWSCGRWRRCGSPRAESLAGRPQKYVASGLICPCPSGSVRSFGPWGPARSPSPGTPAPSLTLRPHQGGRASFSGAAPILPLRVIPLSVASIVPDRRALLGEFRGMRTPEPVERRW
jgi:hypothetical protein